MKKNYKDLIIIFFLGASSGMPLVLILSTLKALLVDKGFDLKTIGFFSLISIPYSIKPLFAPIIDSCAVPFLTKKFGQRRSWIMLTQILLTFFIALLGFSAIFSDIKLITIFALLIAFASASQDIVIDGYRIELIKKEEQGIAAGSYVYGYRIGMLISGAFALAISEILGWDSVLFILSCFMLSSLIITLFANETRKNWHKKDFNFFTWFKNFVIDPLLDFTKKERWYVIIAFIIFFKLGDAFAGNLTLPFLLKIGFSKIEIATIVKTFGLFATLFGVLIGGILVKKIGMIKSLWIAALMQMFSNLAFCYLSKNGYDVNLLYAVIFIENFSGGIGDSVFVAYLSGLCNISFSATQYSLLISCASLARSLLSSSAGAFAEIFGWYNFFMLSTFLALPGLLFLFWITKSNFSK